LTPETYPLPQLGPKLRLLSQRLHCGAGFFIIRGLVPKNYDKIDNTIIHIGISSYIGNKRAIQYEGGPAMCQSLFLLLAFAFYVRLAAECDIVE
jgi:hypothetical protein